MSSHQLPSNTEDVLLFDEIYKEHMRAVYSYALGRTGNDFTAEDLLQEISLRVWRHIGELRSMEPDKRSFWLFAVAKNIVRDHYRRRSTRDEISIDEVSIADEASGDPLRELEAKETASLIDIAIRRLPDDLRTVLTMHVIGSMNSIEIGKALCRPAGTVRYQISEARRRIAIDLRLATGELNEVGEYDAKTR